jgi:glyceraldehyde 3-phosphate dehydrogenase
MIDIGINGFGRIGKCIFLQLLNNNNFNICAINALNLEILELEDYLNYDTNHKYPKIKVNIISENEFKINNHKITLLKDLDAKKLNWKKYNCKYIIDATGAFLTSDKCDAHDVDYVIITAPPKDNTSTFIYGANHKKYEGEKIISASSCTTNCIAPMLKLLNDNYTINDCNFTTIHATTSTQYTMDILNKSSRTNRSIFNNIIPHTTGASSSVVSVLPELKDKINGTSIRVPVSDCSLLDLNVELYNKNITLEDIEKLIIDNPLYKIVYEINKKNLVSSDFMTSITPTILDIKASIDMKNGKFKLMIWYDNEWSYSAQVIRIVEYMYEYNSKIKSKYFIDNIEMENKCVVVRFDYNVPIVDNIITDDFRISSTIKTINTILLKNPKYLVLTSHLGRPKDKNNKDSLKIIIPLLEKYLNKNIIFLENGISNETIEILNNDTNMGNIYLLENLRFHKEEIDYYKIDKDNNEIINLYRTLGNVYISDAFGCLHRNHMSICDIKYSNKIYGYGHLIKKELEILKILVNNKDNKKILGIIGGNKINDKLPLINTLKNIKNTNLFITGGLSLQYYEKYDEEYDNVDVMYDGYGNKNIYNEPVYIESKFECLSNKYNFYDIGKNSYENLLEMINNSDIIFWNGTLGVIEHDIYKKGSVNLANYLLNSNKKIIIGGGETASLFDKNENNNIEISTGGGALLEYLHNKIIDKKNIVGLDIFY